MSLTHLHSSEDKRRSQVTPRPVRVRWRRGTEAKLVLPFRFNIGMLWTDVKLINEATTFISEFGNVLTTISPKMMTR